MGWCTVWWRDRWTGRPNDCAFTPQSIHWNVQIHSHRFYSHSLPTSTSGWDILGSSVWAQGHISMWSSSTWGQTTNFGLKDDILPTVWCHQRMEKILHVCVGGGGGVRVSMQVHHYNKTVRYWGGVGGPYQVWIMQRRRKHTNMHRWLKSPESLMCTCVNRHAAAAGG